MKESERDFENGPGGPESGSSRRRDYRRYPVGVYVLVLACLWALFELIRSVIYFF